MWTEDRVTELRQLWREGISCGLIAKRFGTTRNSVIGKVHRLDLPARKTLVKETRQQDRRYAPGGKRYRQRVTPRLAVKRSGNGSHTYVHRRKEQEAPVIPVRVALPEPVSLDLPLTALQPSQCRWAHGDGPFLFCGAETYGDTYCPHHHARTVQPDKMRPSKKREAEDYFARL